MDESVPAPFVGVADNDVDDGGDDEGDGGAGEGADQRDHQVQVRHDRCDGDCKTHNTYIFSQTTITHGD